MRRMSVMKILLAVAALFLARPAFTQGPATPTAEMRDSIDAVLDVLKNPGLQGPEKAKERRDAIMEIVNKRFDFMEMSRLVLGKYWRERTEAEKKGFSGLFPKILEAAYVNKIEKYDGETVEYLTEVRFDGKALVRTMVVTKSGTRTPIDYRVMKEDRGWMVYDIMIEGVSLVNNYRSQFNDILSQKPYPELEKMLREKVKGL